jgi:hypothetical protein
MSILDIMARITNTKEQLNTNSHLDADADSVIGHKEEAGRVLYLVKWKHSVVSRVYLSKWSPDALRLWDAEEPPAAYPERVQRASFGNVKSLAVLEPWEPAQPSPDQVVRLFHNGHFVCCWGPSWLSTISPLLRSEYDRQLEVYRDWMKRKSNGGDLLLRNSRG